MKVYDYAVGGERCYVRYVETPEDVAAFWRWLPTNRVVAVDTETSDLAVYSPMHKVRLVQFGSSGEAFVLRFDDCRRTIEDALASMPFLVMHNAAYDLAVFDRHGLGSIEALAPKTFDTGILAHLVDPRGKDEGGLGLKLKDLAQHYIAPDADDGEKTLMRVFRSEYGANKSTGWAVIDIDHPDYVRYAGADVLLTHRLFRVLRELVKERGLNDLSRFEHALQGITTRMTRRGLLVDVPYTDQLVQTLADEAERYRSIAAEHGVENVNSNKQIADALMRMGWEPTEFNKTGPKLDKDVMLPLAGLTHDWERIDGVEPNPLADAIVRAKRADGWSTKYAEPFLAERDAYNRIHPSIHSLQARTGRMSISNPPLQQLPSGDWRIRRALVAEPGHVFWSVDFSQVEMRVLAALSEDEELIRVIRSGEDLHDATARRIFGEGFTKTQRKLAKNVGFGKVYGGGAESLAKQTGTPVEQVREVVRAYDRTYRGIKRYSKRLQENIRFGKPEVVTPSGRRLPVDKDRAYSATNYVVQSTARDLLAQALMDLAEAGLEEHLRLPIHDEVLGVSPEGEAKEVAAEVERLMTSTFQGVPILAEAEVGGRSWGSLYGADQ